MTAQPVLPPLRIDCPRHFALSSAQAEPPDRIVANLPLPPHNIEKMALKIIAIDFGYTSARQFWSEVALPAYERFKAEPNRQNGIHASVPAWHVQEWIWCERHPGTETRNNPDFSKFRAQLICDCPELEWIRNVAEAAKHRNLGNPPPKVQRVASQTYIIRRQFQGRTLRKVWATPLTITLDDNSTKNFADVLSRVIDYWQVEYFPP
jgi:hypothetical protein